MKISDLKSYKVVGSATPVSIPKQQQEVPLANKVANFFGAKGITDQFGADIARAKAPTQQEKDLIEYPKMKEVVGSAIQTGANLIPGVGAEAGLATKIGAGLATGYAFDVGNKLQTNQEKPFTPGVGTVVGATTPVAGAILKPATKIVSRLLKGLGSGLSGVSTETINKIVDNPEFAQKASEKLAQNGNSSVLEENAKTIVNGISKVRQEARQNFGQGLEQLATKDIKPQVFKENISKTLDKYGSTIEQGKRTLSNVEFTDPKNLSKASELIDKLQTVKLDGKSIRKLADDIESSAYKVATSDERLSFNAFIKDLSSSLKNSVSASTDKLGEINKAFSNDMQLVETVQNIFGKVNFKNLPEVVKASQKLESVFAQKGLAPDTVDKFLERIGISPNDFKTTEAVRQISNKASGANTKGLTIGEITQQATSAIVTPETVKKIAIKTGLVGQKLNSFVDVLKGMKAPAQKLLINTLLTLEGDQ